MIGSKATTYARARRPSLRRADPPRLETHTEHIPVDPELLRIRMKAWRLQLIRILVETIKGAGDDDAGGHKRTCRDCRTDISDRGASAFWCVSCAEKRAKHRRDHYYETRLHRKLMREQVAAYKIGRVDWCQDCGSRGQMHRIYLREYDQCVELCRRCALEEMGA